MPSQPSDRKKRLRAVIAVGLVASAAMTGGVGMMKRQQMARGQIRKVEPLSSSGVGLDRESAERIAAREEVIIARLDSSGATIFRTGPIQLQWGGASDPTLDATDAKLPPWSARKEVRAALAGQHMVGQYWPEATALVTTVAQPIPEGGALYIVKGLSVSIVLHPAVMVLMDFAMLILIAGIGFLLYRIDRWRTRRYLLPEDEP